MRGLVCLLAAASLLAAGVPQGADALSIGDITMENIRLVNSVGATVYGHVSLHQQAYITVDLTNNSGEARDILFIVQIKDEEGRVVLLEWSNHSMGSHQLHPARSWTPDSHGVYYAEIFVWESFENPHALSKTGMLKIIAS